MNLPGRYFQLIDYLDESKWLGLLEEYSFWKSAAPFEQAKSNNLYFTLMKYNTMIHNCKDADPLSAFGARVPRKFSAHPEVTRLCNLWSGYHTTLYGTGHVAKSGLFVFQPGGAAPYHVDGNVFRAGQAVDLEQEVEWRMIAFHQASRRTILPLLLNQEDEFLIMGSRVRMTPGLFFEFSNGLPHAFFNRGREHTVLLVTSYLAETDRYKAHQVEQ
jgi:hypothetical protein